MNKSALLLAAMVIAAGCSVSEIDHQLFVEEQELIIIADRESQGPETRTVRNESNGAILWTPGDRISLFYGSGTDGGSMFTSQGESESKVTNFTGTIGVITGGADVSVQDTYFWGLYPYDESASCDGTSITMTLPDSQVATPDTFAPNTFPAIGRSPGLNMAFYNICGGLKIQVQKEGLKKVTLHSNDGPIAGKARIVVDESGVPSAAEIIEGSEDIVLEAPAGEYLVPGKNYYFVIFPHEFKDNYFTLTFESFTETGTYERKKPFTITRSVFEGFSVAIDGNVNYEQKSGNVPISDDVFKAYLTSNFDTDTDGEISYSEADAIHKIDLGLAINQYVNLSGIECFTNIDSIIVRPSGGDYSTSFFMDEDESLEEAIESSRETSVASKREWGQGSLVGCLDLTSNKELKYLKITGSYELEDVNISRCPKLEYLDLSNSLIAGKGTIDISCNTRIQELNINNCLFSGRLDLTGLSELKYLACNSNWFSEIVFGDHPNLEYLSIRYGNLPFEALSLAAFPQLQYLDVSCGTPGGGTDGRGYNPSGHLRSLDVTANPKLETLRCYGCNIETPLDLSNCPLLKEVIAFYNEFDTFILTDHPNLTKLYLAGCWHLKELNLTGCPSLEWISTYTCWELAPVDYSHCLSLTTCYAPVAGSNLSMNSTLKFLEGGTEYYDQLQYLTGLEELRTGGFSNLDLSYNTNLKRLTIWNTEYGASVNISSLLNLEFLDIASYAQIPVIDISHNLNLKEFTANGCESLKVVYVSENQVIDGVTVNRSDKIIHPDTQILIAPSTGGNEGSGDHQNEP